jgi:hypothetical protein
MHGGPSLTGSPLSLRSPKGKHANDSKEVDRGIGLRIRAATARSVVTFLSD